MDNAMGGPAADIWQCSFSCLDVPSIKDHLARAGCGPVDAKGDTET